MIFVFEGREFVLEGKDYILPNKQLAIQLMDFDVPSVDIIILGDMFLRRVFTIFDMDLNRVGFGHARSFDLTPTKTMIVLGAVGFTLLVIVFILVNCWIKSKQREEYTPINDMDAKRAVPLVNANGHSGSLRT